MQKHVNLVDLVKSFPTNIYLQKSASIQPRTSHLIFIILAASRDLIFTERSSPGAHGARRSVHPGGPGEAPDAGSDHGLVYYDSVAKRIRTTHIGSGGAVFQSILWPDGDQWREEVNVALPDGTRGQI